MDVKEKLAELLVEFIEVDAWDNGEFIEKSIDFQKIASDLIAHGVTVQEYGEWVHPKEYVVSNDFLCSKCGHREVSYYPINPRPGGCCIADENGNFYYPPKLNYCPNCGVKMDGGAD